MKQVLFLFFLVFVTHVNSQNNNPIIPKEGKLVADFVPNKWKVIAKAVSYTHLDVYKRQCKF